MTTSAIFWPDTSSRAGAGHVSRCLALAGEMSARGWGCTFAISAADRRATDAVRDRGFPLIALPDGSDGDPTVLPRGENDLLVVDHYGLDERFETEARGRADRIAAIDDVPGRAHNCDVLIDPTPGRTPAAYERLVPEHVRRLVGSRYAMIDGRFADLRDEAIAARRVHRVPSRVLVSFGGLDSHNLSLLSLEALEAVEWEGTVDLVVGGSAPHRAELAEYVAHSRLAVRLLEDVDDMASLMARADLAVGAAGVSSLERCCLGLPSVVIVAASNQADVAAGLRDRRAAWVLGSWDEVDAEQLAHTLARLRADPEAVMDLVDAAAAICDGRGSDRVSAFLTDGLDERRAVRK